MSATLGARIVFLLFCAVGLAFGDCPDGAIEGFTEKGLSACYLYERFPAQFVTAERLCRDARGHLASIGDLLVNDFIAQAGVEAFEILGVDNFWIGANDLETRGQWEWIGGADFGFTNWAEAEPADDGRSFCAALSLPEGLWFAQSCYESKPYVCEVPALNTSTPRQKHHKTHKTTTTTTIRPTRHHDKSASTSAKPPPAQCQEEWSFLDRTGLCYKIVKDASDCYRPNTQEASIHSQEENNFVGGLALKEASHSKRRNQDVKVRLSAAQYHPSKVPEHAAVNDKAPAKQVKPWLMPHAWGMLAQSQRRKVFMEMIQSAHHKKHGKSSSSSSQEEPKEAWTWFDGSEFDFNNWAKHEPKRIKKEEFTCVQFHTCYKDCKKDNRFVWSTTSCAETPDYAVCSQKPL